MAALRYAVQSFAAHGLPTTAQGDGDGDGAREAMRLRPLIAYHLGEIDASRGRGVDEGRRRMLPLRVALRQTASGTQRQFDDFVEPASKGCFATHLIGRLPAGFPPVAERNARQAIVDSLLASSDAFDSVRPTVRLVEPQVRTCGPDETDRLDPATRRRCVPIQDYACVAVVDDPAVGDDAKPYVEVCWARELGARAQVPRAAQEAVLRVVRHSAETVAYHFVDFAGRIAPTMVADLPPRIVGNLFERRVDDLPLPSPRAHLDRLPRYRSKRRALPDFLAEYLGAFCQERLRLHVLATMSAARPTGRAFALNGGEFISRRPCERGHSPLTLCLQVHPTSSTCLCPAHNLPPIAQRGRAGVQAGAAPVFSDNSDVVLKVQMCGLVADGEGLCPRHRERCDNGIVAGVCCANVEIDLKCRHYPLDASSGAAPCPGLRFQWK